jgi:hypothetical protein
LNNEAKDLNGALGTAGPLNPGHPNKNRILSDFIIVAPQKLGQDCKVTGQETTTGLTMDCFWGKRAGAIKNIVETVQRQDNGDSRRTYLTGFSLGGTGTFDVSAVQPNFWAALWSVDPCCAVPKRDVGLPTWVSMGELARKHLAGFQQRLNVQPVSNLPWQHRVYTDYGLDHWGTAMKAYADQRPYDWILSKRLN